MQRIPPLPERPLDRCTGKMVGLCTSIGRRKDSTPDDRTRTHDAFSISGDMVKERTDAEGNHERWIEAGLEINGEQEQSDDQVLCRLLQYQEEVASQGRRNGVRRHAA
tara:strand:- start:979 stop:1302 length:324 start_codon:yes stop_codon:yes gene_type:complete